MYDLFVTNQHITTDAATHTYTQTCNYKILPLAK